MAAMTTLGLRRTNGGDARDRALLAAFAVWVLTLLGLQAGYIHLDPGSLANATILFLVPILLGFGALLRRSQEGVLPLVAGSACALTIALVLPLFISGNPKIALVFPLALIGGALAQRFPAATFATIFVLTGTYGTITAFTGIHADSVTDKLIDAAWAGLLGRMLLGRQPRRMRPTPAFYLLLGFLIVSIIGALTTTPASTGVQALRLGPLYLSLVLLLGYGAFSDRVLQTLTRAMIAVSAAVAAYATLRWAIGPAGKEQALQATEFQRQYNQLAGTGDIKLQGSFPNGNSLGLWCACTIPFLVAMAVSMRGRWRLLAAGALPLSAIALFGSAQRAALAGVVAGALTIVVVHVLSRGFRGPRLGIATAAALVLVVSGAVVYPAVVDNPEKQKRYANLLTPSQDQPFQERLNKWRSALDEIAREPLGHGLGAGNPNSIGHRFEDIAYYVIDNSYLMIAYDQGLMVMLLFILVLVVLLVELLRFAIWTRGPNAAALATAGAGTLVAMGVEFMAANYVVVPVIVAGWLVVGLGVAQFGSPRREDAVRERRRPRNAQRVGRVRNREALAHAMRGGGA
jgi:hypothetical protein